MNLTMILATPEHSFSSDSSLGSTKRLANGFYVTLISLMALCAKQASRLSRKLKSKPLKRSRNLLTNISNKAIMVVRRKKGGAGEGSDVGPEEFGDGGVWQRSILMGDKCQPLAFSGVIYYDESGKQLDELPMRSPRASPLPAYLATTGV